MESRPKRRSSRLKVAEPKENPSQTQLSPSSSKASSEVRIPQKKKRKLDSAKSDSQEDQSHTPSPKSDTGKAKPRRDNETVTLLRRDESISDWDEILMDPVSVEWICPVDFFPNAPLSSQWKDFAKVGLKIELEHPQTVGSSTLPVNCIATILLFAGYKALVQFHRIEDETCAKVPLKMWISYCSHVPKPFGFSLRNECLLLPVEGETIHHSGLNYKDIVRDFVNQEFRDVIYSTISDDHLQTVDRALQSIHGHVRPKDIVEVMDRECTSRNRLANVESITGDRICLKYLDADSGRSPGGDLCLNVKSEFIYPVGWSQALGVELRDLNARIPQLSKKYLRTLSNDISIKKGMVLEIRHPLFSHTIMPAIVHNVLKFGYFVAKVLTPVPQALSKCIMHIQSDYVLPKGFCEKHNLRFDEQDDIEFSWEHYLNNNSVTGIGADLSMPLKKSHKFERGHKFEAVDANDTFYMGPATVLNVADHLLYIQFDGWPRETPGSFQWVSALSPDIYPAGFSELVGHNFSSHPERAKKDDQYHLAQRTSTRGKC